MLLVEEIEVNTCVNRLSIYTYKVLVMNFKCSQKCAIAIAAKSVKAEQ
ncbi:MAG: hypothetical protein LH649_00670 [Pseudanabaena sp. CAN_BIN31]|nr:hypothetical protein [Pseudanabaena sp. CAN_BIN31]